MNAVTFPVLKDAVSLQSEARERALGLRELRYFLSVAQTGNVGRAAQLLNVSQPAISLQLRKLEDGLGTQLLLRHGRGVSLTAAGACLRDRLHTIMQLLTSPLGDAETEPLRGSVSLAVPVETGTPLVAPLARMFRDRWPDVTLDVRAGSSGEVETWLLQRHVDLALLPDPPPLTDLETTPILSEPLGLVVPAHAQLALDSRPLSLRDLASDSLILPGSQHWLRRRLDHAAQRFGVHLRPMLQVDSAALSKTMVRGGLGYTVLPQTAVQDEVARGILAFRPLGQPPLSCTYDIAFHRAASNTLVASFAAIACEAVATLAQGGAWPGAELRRSVTRPREAAIA
jgi:LysR family transcriptional regulator, nitrogen assimilation regulatory protein